MLTEIPAEQFSATVEEVTRAVLAEIDWFRPPVDMLQVAQRLDLVVARDSAMDVRARFVRLGGSDRRVESSPGLAKTGLATPSQGRAGRGTILVGDEARPERKQWAIAHEVGESIAHRVFVRLGVALADVPSSGREQVANHLASCLLLPREWLANDGERLGWDLLALKDVYATASHELIARRMLEMQPSVIITMFDQGAMQWRKSNTLGRPPKLTVAESSTWRAAFESGRATEYDESELPEGVNKVTCWPVHEPGWRREFVRTELVQW